MVDEPVLREGGLDITHSMVCRNPDLVDDGSFGAVDQVEAAEILRRSDGQSREEARVEVLVERRAVSKYLPNGRYRTTARRG